MVARYRRRWGLGAATGLIGLFALSVGAPGAEAAPSIQLIAGAGPSTRVVERFATRLAVVEAAKGVTFEVPPKSVKHAGGIRSSKKFIFGRTGRPLNEEEKASGHGEIFLAKMPIAFVAGKDTGVRNLTLDQVCGVYQGKYTNWKEVGGNDLPITLLTREPTEALFLTLKADVPCMREAAKTKYVFKKDHLVVSWLGKGALGGASIGFGAARNFAPEQRIEVEGFSSGVRLGLVYDLANENHPLVEAAKELARSDSWKTQVDAMGLGWPY